MQRRSRLEDGTMRFLFGAGRLCLDFTRTVRERRGATTEGLALPADLARWAQEAHLQVRLDAERLTAADVESARLLREAVYSVVRARATGQVPEADAIERLNAHAAHAPPVPHLRPNGTALEWAAADPLEAALALIARDAVDLVTSPMIGRVRECAETLGSVARFCWRAGGCASRQSCPAGERLTYTASSRLEVCRPRVNSALGGEDRLVRHWCSLSG
jgi:predicted RNA-binding Zn ribbon-like protein